MRDLKLAIYGCGKLADLIVDKMIAGYIPEYRLIGAYSRTTARAQKLSERVNSGPLGYSCKAVASLDELLELQPDYIIEAASPQALKEISLPALKQGVSLICLSIGAFADTDFYEETKEAAVDNNAKIHLVSGAIGGFDVLRTVSFMGDSKVSFTTEKGPRSLRNTEVYTPALEKEQQVVFKGTAEEAIALFPTKVNVAVAASLASVGPQKERVTITSTPDYVGDEHCIHIQNEQVDARLCIYSKTAEIAGWSVLSTLRNIVSPVVFG